MTDLKYFSFYNSLEEEAVSIDGAPILMVESNLRLTDNYANLSLRYSFSLDSEDASVGSDKKASSVSFFEVSVKPFSLMDNDSWRFTYRNIEIQTYFLFDGPFASETYRVGVDGDYFIRSFYSGEAGVFNYDVEEFDLEYFFGEQKSWMIGYRYVNEISPEIFNHTSRSGSELPSDEPAFEIRFDEEKMSQLLLFGYESPGNDLGFSFDKFRIGRSLSVDTISNYKDQSVYGGEISEILVLDLGIRYVAFEELLFKGYVNNRIHHHKNNIEGEAGGSDQWFTEYGLKMEYRFDL